MNPCRIIPAGDSAVVVELDQRIDPRVNARAVAIAESIQALPLPGVRDVVPTYCTVAVYFDPLRTDYAVLVSRIEQAVRLAVDEPATDRATILVPACYGGAFGADLSALAVWAGMSEDDVVALHAKASYRVFMLGFLPGFAYLGTVDPRIAMPRRETPRLRVPSGSIGIAGDQTGIYPSSTPGGWQLIGRTSIKPFDLDRREPALFKVGDLVRFQPVDPAELEGLS